MKADKEKNYNFYIPVSEENQYLENDRYLFVFFC